MAEVPSTFLPPPIPEVEVKRPDPNWHLGVYFLAGVVGVLVVQPVVIVMSRVPLAFFHGDALWLGLTFAGPIVAFALAAVFLRPRHVPNMLLGVPLMLVGSLVGGFLLIMLSESTGA